VFPAPGLLPSAVVAKNYLFLDDTTASFDSNLPLLVISTEGRKVPQSVPPGGARAKGSLMVIDVINGKTTLRSAPQFHGFADFEVFGQSSVGFETYGVPAKMPIRMEIHDEMDNDLKVPLLGNPADSDWRLRNPYDDKTLVNDFLGAQLMEEMGNYSMR